MNTSYSKSICLWSGPRNVSTALMYAFAQRDDTVVLDEPLYGHYLHQSGAEHPGRDTVLANMELDGERVIRQQVLKPPENKFLFSKMMAHHLPGLDQAFLARTQNIILTRDPHEVLPSLAVQLGQPCLRDTGYDVQVAMLEESQAHGKALPVLDARELLLDPGAVLKNACEAMGMGFQEAMLSWEPGEKPYDGVWAPWWYHNVHRSTGFISYKKKPEPFPQALELLLEECLPLYEKLYSAAVKAPLSAH